MFLTPLIAVTIPFSRRWPLQISIFSEHFSPNGFKVVNTPKINRKSTFSFWKEHV